MTGALLALQHYARFSRESEVLSVFIPTHGTSQFSALQELTHALLLRAEADQPFPAEALIRRRAHVFGPRLEDRPGRFVTEIRGGLRIKVIRRRRLTDS